MNKRKILTIITLVFILLSWIYYSNFVLKRNFVELKRGDLTEQLDLFGTVIASDKIELGFQEKGRIDKVYANLEEEVKQGDLLATLNSKELEAELKKAQAEIDVAKARLSQLLAGTRSEELNLFESQVSSAEIDLENAQKNFENIKIKADSDLDGVYQSAINLADPVLLSAEKAMQALNSIYQGSNQFQPFFFIADFKKKSDAEWQIIFTRDAFLKIKEDYQSLKKDRPSNDDVDKILSNFKVNLEIIRVALNKTSEAFKSASVVSGNITLKEFKNSITKTREDINFIQTEILDKERLIKEQKMINQTNITVADNTINAKRAVLAEKEEQLALKKAKPREVEIAVYDAQIKEAKALKSLLAERLQNMKLFAPVSGTINYINIRPGQLIKAGKTVISMSASSDFQIETEVLKKDSGKIRVGDELYVELGFSNKKPKKVKGRIIEINTNKEIFKNDKIYYKVLVAFLEDNIKLKPKMKVSLSINAVLKRNVLLVPERAIIEKDGVLKVVLAEGNLKREVKVKTGLRSDGMVEVLSGLYEGDRVIIQ